MQEQTETLLDLISPQYSGIFWITSQNLSVEIPYFNEMDYLSNGQFFRILQQQDKKDSPPITLVEFQCFDKKMFIVHLCEECSSSANKQSDRILAEVDQIIKIKGIEKQASDKEITLGILNQTDFSYTQLLIKKYKDLSLQFKSLRPKSKS